MNYGNPGSAKRAGKPTDSAAGAMALKESFPSFWHLAIRGPLWLVLLCCLAPLGAYRALHLGSLSVVYLIRDLKITLAGVLLCCFAHQVLIGPPSLGCFSCLVLCSEREAAEIALLSVCDSAVSPCLQVSWLSFISIFHCNSPSGSLTPSPFSQQQTLPWDCFPISMFQLQATALSRGLESLSGVCMAVARIVCVILIPFRLSQISCFTLQQPQCFTSVTNICSPMQHCSCFSSPTPGADSVPLTLLSFAILPLSC